MKIALVILIFVIFPINCGRDFYQILNVPKSANSNQIKKAYRTLAKQLHPDKNKNDPDSESRFRDLNSAYETLSDTEKRKIYDRHGEEGLKDNQQGGPSMDPFSSFFGDVFFDMNGGGGGNRHKDTPKGGDVTMDLFVTLEELYNGNFVEVVRYKSVKKQSHGTRKCNCRHEMRTFQTGPGRFQMSQEQVCDECPNVRNVFPLQISELIQLRFVPEEKLLEIEIESGMRDGHVYPFVAEGEPHIDGDPGDLKFRIRQTKHERFERRSDDLYTNVTISLLDALSGFSMNIVHLDGHKVKVVREKVTWPGAKIKKPDEGMPNYENNHVKGALFITIDVAFPKDKNFGDEEKQLFEKLLSSDITPQEYNGLAGFKSSVL